METKICTGCGHAKPIEEFYFVRTRNHRMSICDICRRANRLTLYRRNKAVEKAKMAAYYQENKESIKARTGEYQKENRAAATQNHRRWKERQPRGLLAAQTRAKRAADPDRKAKQNAYVASRRNEINEQARVRNKARYHRDIEMSRATQRAFRAANQDYCRSLSHAQLAKKAGILERYPDNAIAEIMRLQRGRCAYCRRDIRKCFHVDHIKARANGGGNTRSNIQLTCPRCNRSKGKKDPIVFAQSLGRLL